MKGKTSIMALIVAFCFCLVLIQLQVKTCMAQGSTFKLVDVLLDYGNGTRKWASCILQTGSDTVYNATQLVATSLNVSWYDGAAFVNAIDNVWNNYAANTFWMWWIWNSSAGSWELGPIACNQYALEDCDMVAWYYENCTTWPPSPPPNPPATKVDVLLDYGNGTRVSYEGVEVLGFASVLKATKMVATVEISLWGTDAFVEAIDNIWNDYVNYVYFWIYWYWNQSAKCWKTGQVAANKHVLANGDTIAWLYEDCTVWPPASPPVTKVDILLDYGNTTRVWYENVELPGTPSVLKATKAVASVEYTLWGTDVFVDAINGVWNSYPYYWMWWYWNHTAKGWESGPVTCNKYMLIDGDIIAWYYENCTVWPVEPPPLTPHPTASFTWTPSIPKVGQTVTFDASASVPNGGTIVDYAWNFGDGSISHGQMVVHAYSSPGTYTITLNVTDTNGLWDVEQKQITVVQPHGPKADFKAVPEIAKVGESIKFDASTSLPGWNGTHTMPITEYRWNFGDGNVTVTSQPVVYHSYGAAGNYYVTLTVYSPGATPETDSTTVKVTVFAVPVGGQSVSIETSQTKGSLEIYTVLVAIITVTFAVVKRNIAKRYA